MDISRDQAKADQVAELFFINSRKRNRRLNAFGTRFQELADESRFEIARHMLSDSEREVRQIAAAPGYAMPVLSRAHSGAGAAPRRPAGEGRETVATIVRRRRHGRNLESA